MRSEPVVAAAPGLPDEPATDFHLAIGRQLALLKTEIERVENEEKAIEACQGFGASYMSTAGDHFMDRDDILIRTLSAFPASSIAGAAVQVAAAVKLYELTRLFDGDHTQDIRAIDRLLHSALSVLVEHAGLDRDRDGISRLAERAMDCWADPSVLVAELFPDVGNQPRPS